MKSLKKMIDSPIFKSIEGVERFYNLSSGYWVYNDLISDLKASGWVRFAPGFKAGLYGHPDTEMKYNGKRICIKILGMGVGENPQYFCERGYYLEHERNMLQDFRSAGFTFSPEVLTQQESVNFLIDKCQVRPEQAEKRVFSNDVLLMEYFTGLPFATQTGKFLNYDGNIVLFDETDRRKICSALEGLHMQLEEANNNELLHNDVVPPNIIFIINAKNQIEAKLVDFELAQNLKKPSPDYVNNSVHELYLKRNVPINHAGDFTKNLDQYLIDESIKITEKIPIFSTYDRKILRTLNLIFAEVFGYNIEKTYESIKENFL